MKDAETIFDHEPTADELSMLFFEGMTSVEYLEVEVDANTRNGDIGRLYDLRGNSAKAEEYYRKISSADFAVDLQLRDTEQ